MIQVLENPKTSNYQNFKFNIQSYMFPFFYESKSTRRELDIPGHANIPYYVHEIIQRPEKTNLSIPMSVSPSTSDASEVVRQILEHNNIQFKTFLRMAINAVHPAPEVLKTVPHTDHVYDHKNFLLYFTSAGGKTVVEGESYDPVEDSAIIFSGKHYHETPKSERRVVLVATYV